MSFRERWTAAVDGRWLVPLLALLAAIRFGGATVTAFLGIEGLDTRGLDTIFEVYSDALLLILVAALSFELRTWGPALVLRRTFLGFLMLAAAATLFWAGTANPALRPFPAELGPWIDFLAGISAAAGLGALTSVIANRLQAIRASHAALDGFRAFGFGFSAALLLRSIRLLDFRYLFGWSIPSGLLWMLDFGPSLVLSGIGIVMWLILTLPRTDSPRDRMLALAPPVLLAAVGFAMALGLGGFVASNALAWGGSYTVFAPTNVSLAIVGFAVGAYLATALCMAREIPPNAERLLFGGIAIAALAGIQTSTGLLTSFVGLLTGLVVSARGVTHLVARSG